MAKAVVCIGDYCSGIPAHVCMSGSSDVFKKGRSVCRKGDIVTLGETITQGSNSVFVNGIGVARTGDMVSCGFKVIGGSSSVFLDKDMKGMSARTGKALEGIEHLKQSIIDILTTPIGSRIMRRNYGSRLLELVDRPINRDFSLEIYAATAGALEKWEKRFKLEKVKITEVKEGKVTISLDGIYLPNGENIRFDGVVV